MILHIPHSSTLIPLGIQFDKDDIEEDLYRLTDCDTDKLFTFDGAEVIKFKYSRLFCDVERFTENEPMELQGHGICYTKDSFGNHLRNVSKNEREFIIENYYKPHHTKLTIACNAALTLFDTVVIVDCHSFSDEVLPHEPNKDGNRPDFCLGVDDFHTPLELVNDIKSFLEGNGFVVAINNPFSGTIVPTLHYNKTKNLKSIMIEVNRKLYLNKTQKEFDKIKQVIRNILFIINRYEEKNG